MRYEPPYWTCVFVDGDGRVNLMNIQRVEIPGNAYSGNTTTVEGMLVPETRSKSVAEQFAYGLVELLDSCSAYAGTKIVQKEGQESRSQDAVSRILRSGPCTHVFWSDGTKTTVRRAPDEDDSDYAAFAAALAIKVYGSNSALKRMLRKKTEVQQPKKKKSTGCTDTCPIDLDRIDRELALANSAKTKSEASEHIANAIIGNVT